MPTKQPPTCTRITCIHPQSEHRENLYECQAEGCDCPTFQTVEGLRPKKTIVRDPVPGGRKKRVRAKAK